MLTGIATVIVLSVIGRIALQITCVIFFFHVKGEHPTRIVQSEHQMFPHTKGENILDINIQVESLFRNPLNIRSLPSVTNNAVNNNPCPLVTILAGRIQNNPSVLVEFSSCSLHNSIPFVRSKKLVTLPKFKHIA